MVTATIIITSVNEENVQKYKCLNLYPDSLNNLKSDFFCTNITNNNKSIFQSVEMIIYLTPKAMQNFTVGITNHACIRARERFRWNPQTLERMSARAFECGIKRKNSKGYLKKYIDRLLEGHPHTSIKVYGETVFIFRNKILITIWSLPLELRPLAKAIKLKQKKPRFDA